MFVGDRLWIFNYPQRVPPSQQLTWLKNVNSINNNGQTIERNLVRPNLKPDLPPFFYNDRSAFERNIHMAANVKIPAQTRIVPREVYNNMAITQRNMEVYKNNIISQNNTQESNVDHLRRLEENFSI